MDIRYHIIPDEGSHRVMIFDSETGAIQHPVCWQDIAAYHNYLIDRGRIHEAQHLLAESMAGRKPITSMVAGIADSHLDLC